MVEKVENAAGKDEEAVRTEPTIQELARAAKKKKKKMRKGGVNLVLLGVGAVVVTIATTGVSLAIYHNSGDIYLDRSRPGYLPDEAEIQDEEEKAVEYELDKTGKMTAETLEEYIENLEKQVETVDAYEKPFGQEGLSDERLGIPKD